MPRRSFFKCLAVGLGGALAYGQQERSQRDLDKGRARLEEKTHALLDEVSAMNGHTAFANCFSTSPSGYLQQVAQDKIIAAKLQHKDARSVVEPARALENSLHHAAGVVSAYDKEPPSELAEALRYCYATRELKKAASVEALAAGTAPFKELGLVVLRTLGVLVPYELFTAWQRQKERSS
jgi:hypothetical protein